MIDQRFLDDLAQDLQIPDENQEEMQLASANTGVTTDGGAFVGYRLNMPKGLNTPENMAKQSTLIANTLAGQARGVPQAFGGIGGDLETVGRMALNVLGFDVSEDAVLPTSQDIAKKLESLGVSQENISGLIDRAMPSQAGSATAEEKARAFGGGETLGEVIAPGGQIKLAGKVIKATKDLPVGMSVANATVKDVSNSLMNKYDGLELDLYDSKNTNVITLSKIVVPKNLRKSGIGSDVMTEITSFADEGGKTIALSPSVDFGGTSVNRLKDFYKQFGFVENKGKNKDFSISESMYRLPKSKNIEESK
jgi:predicted GNAT family acetyltransferase